MGMIAIVGLSGLLLDGILLLYTLPTKLIFMLFVALCLCGILLMFYIKELKRKEELKRKKEQLDKELDEDVKKGKTRTYIGDRISIGIRAIIVLSIILYALLELPFPLPPELQILLLFFVLLPFSIVFLMSLYEVFTTYATSSDALEIKRPFGEKTKIYWDDVKSIEERKEYRAIREFCIFDDVAITLITRQGKKVRFFLSAFGEYLYHDIKKRLEERGVPVKIERI